jgi:ferredoxin-NADP reductase/MOSC domain-containing protein YiiM
MHDARDKAQAVAVGRLVSVNIGRPREVSWQGGTVRTAIWKEPVSGPAMVRRLNIDGDDQADRAAHGGEHRAVFVYQLDSHRYWERELGRDDFTPGQFGENFTVEGLGDDEVCVGDRYRIGGALFEVTQPRVTCFRVGIRMDEPRMPSLLVAHRRPGFYLRVLEEGQVQAGDEILCVAAGPEQLTIAEIDGLLYLPNRPARTLRRALGIPALSEGWKGSFRALLEQGERPAAPTPAWEGFRALTVTAVTRESAQIVSVRVAAPAGERPLPPSLPGQYLTVRLYPQGPDGPALIRSYSLSSVGGAGGYRISVKREPGGIGSGYVHERLAVGDVIEAAAPRGSFTLRAGARPVALISAGVGATPVLAMLHALATAGDPRPVWWIHGARDGFEHAFRAEVEALLAQLAVGRRVIAYSRPGACDRPDATGRITIQTLLDAGIPVDADYYLCGPERFMHGLSAALAARGTGPERISFETFGSAAVIAPPGRGGDRPPPHPPAGPVGSGPAVTFARSNLTVAWDPGYANLLELAEACDVPVSFGCRNGVCHYCEAGLLTGAIAYGTEPLERPGAGRLLMCCAQPTDEITVEL